MNLNDSYRFFKISGVENRYIEEAQSFILEKKSDSKRSFYTDQNRAFREKHLSMLMLKKYMRVLNRNNDSTQILDWWNSINAIPQKINGDIHIHTIYSDGLGSMDKLVLSAENMGYTWIGFSDHSPVLNNPFRINNDSFRDRHRKIIELRHKTDILIYESLEADIADDGSIIVPESWRDLLDFVIASLHEEIYEPERALDRIGKALEDPLTIALAHPFYGLSEEHEREYIPKLLDLIESRGKALEFNLAPEYLIRNCTLASYCKDRKIEILFSTDSHFVPSLNLMKFASVYYPDMLNNHILNFRDSLIIES